MRHVVALSLLIAIAPSARGQAMDDPMRPPGAAGTTGAGAASAPGTRLQVVITSTQRNLALIDGSVVPLGAAVKDARLAAVSDSLAVLRKNGERNVLLMHPNIEKKPAKREQP